MDTQTAEARSQSANSLVQITLSHITTKWWVDAAYIFGSRTSLHSLKASKYQISTPRGKYYRRSGGNTCPVLRFSLYVPHRCEYLMQYCNWKHLLQTADKRWFHTPTAILEFVHSFCRFPHSSAFFSSVSELPLSRRLLNRCLLFRPRTTYTLPIHIDFSGRWIFPAHDINTVRRWCF